MSKNYKFALLLFSLVIIILLYALFRSTFTKTGDFIGYVMAGNFVLNGENIYRYTEINTWPPFFSIFSVPIAIIDNFSQYLVRFLWLLGSIIAMYAVINHTTKLTINKTTTISFKSSRTISHNSISIVHWIVLIPLLIILRYIWANLGNIQINIYMLLLAMLCISSFSKGKDNLAALFLAFSISLKVYTIFIFLYFVIKREYKIVGYTLLFVAIFSVIPFLVFGIEQTVDYYIHWYEHNVKPFAFIGHKNQSYFSMVRRLFIHESPGLHGPLNKAIYVNILDLDIKLVKRISYLLLAIPGVWVVYLFRDKLQKRKGLKVFIEYAFILTLLPILTPLSWKSNFIFLFPAYYLNYLILFHSENQFTILANKALKVLFFISIFLTILSSEIFIGNYLSDILEVYSCIAIGTILIAINLVWIYIGFDKIKIELT